MGVWWRHRKETFSALLAICAGNSQVPGEFPAQRPVTQSFDVFFDLRLNKRLSKHSWGWWFETLSRPLWRLCNVVSVLFPVNSLRHIDAIGLCHHGSWSPLVNIMVCRLSGTVPNHYQNQGSLIVTWILRRKFQWFVFIKMHSVFLENTWKCCLHNVGHFSSMVSCCHLNKPPSIQDHTYKYWVCVCLLCFIEASSTWWTQNAALQISTSWMQKLPENTQASIY